MNQSRVESIIERLADMTTGFLISWTVYEMYVFPSVPAISGFWVTAMFTAISLVRGYLWRRFFNNGLHKVVHKYVTNWRKQ